MHIFMPVPICPLDWYIKVPPSTRVVDGYSENQNIKELEITAFDGLEF